MPSQVALRAARSRTGGGQVFLDLMTITHPTLGTPIRLVNNTKDIVSRGNTFTRSAFNFTPPAQVEDGEPTASIEIENVSRIIEEVLAGLTSEPTFTGEVVLASSPDTVQLGPFVLPLSSAELTQNSIRLTLGFANPLLMRVFPNVRYNSGDFPGLSTLD